MERMGVREVRVDEVGWEEEEGGEGEKSDADQRSDALLPLKVDLVVPVVLISEADLEVRR